MLESLVRRCAFKIAHLCRHSRVLCGQRLASCARALREGRLQLREKGVQCSSTPARPGYLGRRAKSQLFHSMLRRTQCRRLCASGIEHLFVLNGEHGSNGIENFKRDFIPKPKRYSYSFPCLLGFRTYGLAHDYAPRRTVWIAENLASPAIGFSENYRVSTNLPC